MSRIRAWLGSAWSFLGGSIRGQILLVLIVLLFLGSVSQAVLFYVKARSVALSQIRESYKSLGLMVGGLSAYDIQFNKEGLQRTLESMTKNDSNLLWVEFADDAGQAIKQGGELKSSPYKNLGALVDRETLSYIPTPTGRALLVRVPIKASAPSASIGELGFPAPSAPAANAKTNLGELRLVVSLGALSTLKRSYLIFGVLAVLVVLLLGTFLSYLVTRYLVAPIYKLSSLAQEIASGNLRVSEEAARRHDELGRLTTTFKEMAGNLSGMIGQIRGAFQRVEEDTNTFRVHLGHTLENTGTQDAAAQQVAAHISAIQDSVKEVSGLMEGLSQLSEEVSASVLEMVASIDQIAASADGLTESVNQAQETLSQNVQGIQRIDDSAETLNRFVEETSAAITEMESNILQIKQNVEDTRKATEDAVREAEGGVQVVERSTGSIEALQGSFGRTVETMKHLGERSEEIGNVLAVIDEVMEQTHLLALNAAIIAAQAGEHGKAFAVVADEIRDLAEKTSVSTREISEIISTVQKEVQQAVTAVSSQSDVVAETVKASGETGSSFKRIRQSVEPTMQMVQEIVRATEEQSKGATAIVRSIDQVRELTHQLREATREQSSGSQEILEAVKRIRSLSEEVKRATREQSTGSNLIRQAMDQLTNAVSGVMSQTRTQTEATGGAESSLEGFREASRASVQNIQEASKQVESLAERADEVRREMDRFRT
ncbi:MAG: HAMP domain-containing methyl-accepting chemotaxis protein [Acidobacteriota bacterium]|jgi:methyl-accepting chemotaxis protein